MSTGIFASMRGFAHERRAPRRESKLPMIGVVVPVHNEERRLGACLASVRVAARHRDLKGEPVRILAVLDACTDGSRSVACQSGAETLMIRARNVGIGRREGAALL